MTGNQLQLLDLCNPDGTLNRDAIAWTRLPGHRCNLSGHRFRKKRWNYWAVQNERFALAAGIADLDYAATAFVYLVDLERREVVERSVVTPFARGCTMGERVGSPANFRSGRITFSSHEEGEVTSVLFTCEDFSEGDRLSAALRVFYPEHCETLGVVVPLDDTHFQYTSKHFAVPVTARVRIGQREIPFEWGETFATLDFGRGVWPRRTTWNWGSAAGYTDGEVVGLNLGGKWTDGTGATENAVSVNGRLTKVDEDLEWSYDPGNFLKPWRVRTTRSGSIDLVFEPVVERKTAVDVLLVRSHVHQFFGTWSGTVVDEHGRKVRIAGLRGWAEEHRALW